MMFPQLVFLIRRGPDAQSGDLRAPPLDGQNCLALFRDGDSDVRLS